MVNLCSIKFNIHIFFRFNQIKQYLNHLNCCFHSIESGAHMYIPTLRASKKTPTERAPEDKKAMTISKLSDLSLVLYPF
jgi:hypothetical protein